MTAQQILDEIIRRIDNANMDYRLGWIGIQVSDKKVFMSQFPESSIPCDVRSHDILHHGGRRFFVKEVCSQKAHVSHGSNSINFLLEYNYSDNIGGAVDSMPPTQINIE